MAKTGRAAIVQVPMKGELVDRIDEGARRAAESRAEFIREACRRRLEALEEEELERRYIEGYQRQPESADWADTAAHLLAAIAPKDVWP